MVTRNSQQLKIIIIKKILHLSAWSLRGYVETNDMLPFWIEGSKIAFKVYISVIANFQQKSSQTQTNKRASELPFSSRLESYFISDNVNK